MKPFRLSGSVIGIVAAALIGHHAKAAEGGLEWTQINEDETRIVLYAPGLEGGVKRFHKAQTQAPYYVTLEVGIWVGPSGRYPRAEIVVTDLGGDYHFDVKLDLKKETRELGMLKDKKVNFHEKGTSHNVIGQISYLRFTFESRECVSFSQYWGTPSHHDGFSEGTAKLVGYYCVGAAEGLSADTISAVLAGIGVKGEGVPERKVAKVELPLTGRWEGFQENLSGKLLSTSLEANSGRMWLKLPGETGECSGEWAYQPGWYGSPAQFASGRWSMTCTNGMDASGTYVRTAERGTGHGTGKDNNGSLISFSYRP